ncbi:MAG TPA: gamma-glutamyltransferase [Clostridia bacterium]|nr:gamma-glutamyltransferase [Clostridia bacterium]
MSKSDEGYKSFDSSGKMIRTGRGCIGENGIVAAGKYEASKAGIEILKRGGNAFDAAVAVGFVIGVCEPNASGLGGGGFMTARFSETGENIFVDFREVAPKMARPDMWETGNDGEIVNNENLFGGKAVGVPGEAAGLIYILEHYGTMSLEAVMEPAIRIALEGYAVSPLLAEDMRENISELRKYEATARTYLKNNNPYTAGEIIKNPDLANTLRMIAEGGKDAFYKGEVAKSIVKSVQAAKGVLTMEDLAGYRVRVRRPVSGSYRGYEIVSSPPPSSGGTHLIQILNLLECFDVGATKVNSAGYLHLLSEAFKLCYADRAEYMGDTDFVRVPLYGLVSKAYAKKLARKIDIEKSQEYKCNDPWAYEHKDTTHFSVVDKAGNLVAVTQTIDHFFGSCIVAEGTGIILNNQMSDFSFGCNKANSIAPCKKPLSSMSPTLILKEGKPFMVLGSPGGSKIISSLVQVISKVIDHNMEIQEAVEAPRISDDTENKILYESRISDEAIKRLREMGHEALKIDAWDRQMGSVQAVRFEDNGILCGAADPRRDGKALGY